VAARAMTTSSPAPGRGWHALGVAEVLAHLGTAASVGLAPEEARRRLHRVGPNRIADHPETPLWRLLLGQFRSVVVLLLLAVTVSYPASGAFVGLTQATMIGRYPARESEMMARWTAAGTLGNSDRMAAGAAA